MSLISNVYINMFIITKYTLTTYFSNPPPFLLVCGLFPELERLVLSSVNLGSLPDSLLDTVEHKEGPVRSRYLGHLRGLAEGEADTPA